MLELDDEFFEEYNKETLDTPDLFDAVVDTPKYRFEEFEVIGLPRCASCGSVLNAAQRVYDKVNSKANQIYADTRRKINEDEYADVMSKALKDETSIRCLCGTAFVESTPRMMMVPKKEYEERKIEGSRKLLKQSRTARKGNVIVRRFDPEPYNPFVTSATNILKNRVDAEADDMKEVIKYEKTSSGIIELRYEDVESEHTNDELVERDALKFYLQLKEDPSWIFSTSGIDIERHRVVSSFSEETRKLNTVQTLLGFGDRSVVVKLEEEVHNLSIFVFNSISETIGKIKEKRERTRIFSTYAKILTTELEATTWRNRIYREIIANLEIMYKKKTLLRFFPGMPLVTEKDGFEEESVELYGDISNEYSVIGMMHTGVEGYETLVARKSMILAK